jgi:hypothetical protein
MIKTEKQREQLIRWIMAVKRGRVEQFIQKGYGHYDGDNLSDKLTGQRLWFQSLLTNEQIGKIFTHYIFSTSYLLSKEYHHPKELLWLGFKALCFNTDVNDMREICEDFERIIKEEDEKYKEELE